MAGGRGAVTHPPQGGPIPIPRPPRGRPRSGSGTNSGSMRMWSGAATARTPRTSTPCWGGATPHLMPTDPPYGVNYAPEWRAHVDGGASHAVGRVANDHRADWTAAYRLFTGDVVYVWHAGLYASTVAASLQAAGSICARRSCGRSSTSP